MKRDDLSLLFLGKEDDPHVGQALAFCEEHFGEVEIAVGKWGDPKPELLRTWSGDVLVSYLSRWIIPGPTLERARLAALNFHPATPDYPGVGCVNFALYEEVPEYGVTCHHMDPTVDTGAVVAVSRFPVAASDDVASLLARSYDEMLVLFRDMMELLLQDSPLPKSSENWSRPPFTRPQLDALATLRGDMSQAEIERRVRATRFGSWEPSFADEEGGSDVK